jgi:hypothetical protein
MKLLLLTLLVMQRSAPGDCQQLQGLAAAAPLQRGVKLLQVLVMLLGVLATAVVLLLLGVHQHLLLLLLLLLVHHGQIHGTSLPSLTQQQLLELAPRLHSSSSSSSSSRRKGSQQPQ